ncbi:MAG: glycosyltransferase [Actinomycetota bacterium]
MARRWVVLREHRRRWGGDLRRHHIFKVLAETTNARTVSGWTREAIELAFDGSRRRPFHRRPLLASVEPLAPDALDLARRLSEPAVVDILDDHVAMSDTIGLPLDPAHREHLQTVMRTSIETFPLKVVQSRSFRDLIGLDPATTLIASNGADLRTITPMPWPDEPGVAIATGAAPGRGIEALIDAARLVRATHRDLVLYLWLVATGEASERYLASLLSQLGGEPWIRVATGSLRDRLGEALGRATVLVVPNPESSYWDAVIPIKLADSLAAGRPVVVTPRTEMKMIIERTGGGIVAADDSPEAIADAIERLLGDSDGARRMGAAARAAAEAEFDWRVIGRKLSDEILSRV